MKRLFIIIPIALIVCASTIKQSEPPTFKQDMEAFYSILENSLTQLETGGDTTSICETIKNAAEQLDGRWAVDIEMENAETLWPNGESCRYYCARSFLQCNRGNPFFWVVYCSHVYFDCIKCCRLTNLPCN
jgi:hypothetical protein